MSIIQRLFQGAIAERQKITLSLLEENPGAQLLDCGCGNGELTLKVAARIGTGHIHGIDTTDEDIAQAQSRGITVHPCDPNGPFPIEDATFDVIYASEVIEHLYDTDHFLKECHRVLKDSGYLVVETPNLAALHNIFSLLIGKQPPPATVSNEIFAGAWGARDKEVHTSGPGHCRIFTLAALAELLEHHGFSVEMTRGSVYYPLPVPAARLMCRIDKNHAAYIAVKARKT